MTSLIAELPELITTQQLSEITGEHVGSIRRGIAENRIPADKVNGRWMISKHVIFRNTLKALGAGDPGCDGAEGGDAHDGR